MERGSAAKQDLLGDGRKDSRDKKETTSKRGKEEEDEEEGVDHERMREAAKEQFIRLRDLRFFQSRSREYSSDRK